MNVSPDIRPIRQVPALNMHGSAADNNSSSMFNSYNIGQGVILNRHPIVVICSVHKNKINKKHIKSVGNGELHWNKIANDMQSGIKAHLHLG